MAEVEVTRDGAVLTLTLNRPDVLNAINGAVHRGIAAGLRQARAFEWMTSNRKLSAAEASQWGLVSAVVPDDELSARAAELAGRYAAAPTKAVAMTKRLLDQAQLGMLEEQLELEAQLQTVAT